MQDNIVLNKLEGSVRAEILNWYVSITTYKCQLLLNFNCFRGEEIKDPEVSNADVILASDCIYHESSFPILIDTFLSLTTNKNTIIYLAYRKRRNADKRFFQMAKKKFEFIDIMEDPKREEYSRQGMRLFIVKRKTME